MVKKKATKKKAKKARLGRGLEALLGGQESSATAAAGSRERSNLRQLPIEQLQRGKYQPRLKMKPEALKELAETIRKQGIIQPLLVREIARNRYEIIAGERRWRAAQLAKLTKVPVVIKEIDDQNTMVMALIENIQREDLNVMEEALGMQRLLDDFGLTHEQVAKVIGRSRSSISNSLRLLTLHKEVKTLLNEGKMEMGHGRALLGLPPQAQAKAAKTVVDEQLSVRQTEVLVKNLLGGGGKKSGTSSSSSSSSSGTEKNTDVQHLEDDLSKRIGARVSIQHRDKNGKVVIYYHSLDELDGILAHIK